MEFGKFYVNKILLIELKGELILTKFPISPGCRIQTWCLSNLRAAGSEMGTFLLDYS